MLDSLLLVKGEAERTFRWGLGVDLKQPYREALALMSPPTVVKTAEGLPQHDSAWMFHIDARNVLATQWHPRWQDDQVSGLRIRMVETEGRSGRVAIRSIRPIKSARKTDAWGVTTDSCDVSDDQLTCTMAAFEHADIEVTF